MENFIFSYLDRSKFIESDNAFDNYSAHQLPRQVDKSALNVLKGISYKDIYILLPSNDLFKIGSDFYIG